MIFRPDATSRERGPIAHLPPQGRRALVQLGLLAALRAIGLVLLAEAIARGIAHPQRDDLPWLLTIGSTGVVLRAAADWLSAVIARHAADGVREDLRLRLARRILATGGSDLKTSTGTLSALGGRGVDDLDAYFSTYLPALASAAVMPVLIGMRILAADWIAALTIALIVPIVPAFMVLIGTYTKDRVERAADETARLSHHIVELAMGLPVLVGLGRAAGQAEALRDLSVRAHKRTMTTLRVAFMSSLALELIATLGVAFVAVGVGLRLVHGSMPLETGLLALLLAPDCFTPIRQVGAAFHASEDGVEALRRIDALIATPISPGPVPTMSAQGHITVTGLTVRYRNRHTPAIDGLTATIPTNSTVVLDGESGSGKSTLLRVMAGLLRTGEAADIRGAIAGIDPQRIAWVAQAPTFSQSSVREEMASVGPTDTESLAVAKVAHLVDRDPATLSPGEQRRVAMARALARIAADANVLLLDEPTAHLDAHSAAVIRQVIQDVQGRVTIILASHDPSTRALADTVIALGSPSENNIPGSEPHTENLSDAQETIVPETQGEIRWRSVVSALLAAHRRPIAIAMLFGAMATIAASSLTALSGWLIVRASEQPPILYLLTAIVGVRFFGILRAAARYLERVWMHDASLHVATDVRMRLWSWLARRGLAHRADLTGSHTLDRLVSDVDGVRDLLPRVILPPVAAAAVGIVACGVTGFIDPMAGLVLLIVVATALIVVPILMYRVDTLSLTAERHVRSAIARQFTAMVSGAEDICANNMSAPLLRTLADAQQAASRLQRRSVWASGAGNAAITSAIGLGTLAVMVITRGEVVHTMMALVVLMPLTLLEPAPESLAATRFAHPLRDVLSRVEPSLASPPAYQLSTRVEGTIESIALADVSVRWPGASSDAVSNISFEANADRWTVLVGPSGSGKSTLLAVLMGALAPSSGTLLVNGKGADEAAVRSRVAWCPQDAYLFDSTFRGNLLIARDRHDAPDDAEMHDVVRRVGLGPLMDTLPDGLDTRIGAGGSHLSGGQRQRLSVARALLTRADIMLLDEPTAHLDRAAADALLADLRSGLGGTIVVMVTHRPHEIDPDDAVVRL